MGRGVNEKLLGHGLLVHVLKSIRVRGPGIDAVKQGGEGIVECPVYERWVSTRGYT